VAPAGRPSWCADILTGEIDADTGDSGKYKGAQLLGRKGAAALRDKPTPEKRAEMDGRAPEKAEGTQRSG